MFILTYTHVYMLRRSGWGALTLKKSQRPGLERCFYTCQWVERRVRTEIGNRTVRRD